MLRRWWDRHSLYLVVYYIPMLAVIEAACIIYLVTR